MRARSSEDGEYNCHPGVKRKAAPKDGLSFSLDGLAAPRHAQPGLGLPALPQPTAPCLPCHDKPRPTAPGPACRARPRLAAPWRASRCLASPAPPRHALQRLNTPCLPCLDPCQPGRAARLRTTLNVTGAACEQPRRRRRTAPRIPSSPCTFAATPAAREALV